MKYEKLPRNSYALDAKMRRAGSMRDRRLRRQNEDSAEEIREAIVESEAEEIEDDEA